MSQTLEQKQQKRHLRYMAKREELLAYQKAYYREHKEQYRQGYWRRKEKLEREKEERQRAALARASIRAYCMA